MLQLRWSYGVHLLAQSDEQVSIVDLTEPVAILGLGGEAASSSSDLLPITALRSNPSSRTSNGSLTRSLFTSAWHGIYAFGRGFVQFMTMPLFAALASIVVALTPPLQYFLDKPVHPVKGFLDAAGNCSIPVTLIILGAYFYQEPRNEDEIRQDQMVKPGVIERAIAFRRGTRSPSPPLIDLDNVEDLGDRGPSSLNRSSGAEAQILTDLGTSGQADEDTGFLLSDSSLLPPAAASGPPRRGLGSSWASASALAANVQGAFKPIHARSRPDLVGAENGRERERNRQTPSGETKTVIVALISRMILIPLVVLPLLSVVAYYNLHPVFDE